LSVKVIKVLFGRLNNAKKMLPDLYLEHAVSVQGMHGGTTCRSANLGYLHLYLLLGDENSSRSRLSPHMNARLLIYLLVLSAYNPCFE
jgi:hypothetical protein